MKNPFAKFTTEVKTAKIKALGDAEIKYRELTLAEQDALTKLIIKGYDGDKPEIDFNAATEIKYEKVAAMLVDPKMTVDDLKALPASASDAVNEIAALGEDAEGEEGN